MKQFIIFFLISMLSINVFATDKADLKYTADVSGAKVEFKQWNATKHKDKVNNAKEIDYNISRGNVKIATTYNVKDKFLSIIITETIYRSYNSSTTSLTTYRQVRMTKTIGDFAVVSHRTYTSDDLDVPAFKIKPNVKVDSIIQDTEGLIAIHLASGDKIEKENWQAAYSAVYGVKFSEKLTQPLKKYLEKK